MAHAHSERSTYCVRCAANLLYFGASIVRFGMCVVMLLCSGDGHRMLFIIIIIHSSTTQCLRTPSHSTLSNFRQYSTRRQHKIRVENTKRQTDRPYGGRMANNQGNEPDFILCSVHARTSSGVVEPVRSHCFTNSCHLWSFLSDPNWRLHWLCELWWEYVRVSFPKHYFHSWFWHIKIPNAALKHIKIQGVSNNLSNVQKWWCSSYFLSASLHKLYSLSYEFSGCCWCITAICM